MIKIVRWEADGGAINVPVGFIPDFIHMVERGADTAIKIYEFFRQEYKDGVTGYMEGISILEGVTANLADSAGITPYDTTGERPTINTWTTARSTAATARTATAMGTLISPTTTNANRFRNSDVDSIFECVTAGTGGATEPDWTKAKGIGQQITDGSTVWERVNEARAKSGYKGFSIVAGLQTSDGLKCYAVCIKADEVSDLGDVDGWASGVATDLY